MSTTDTGPAQAGGGRGVEPLLYLFVTPAALTLISGLGEVVDFSELFHRLLRVWRAATHWAWDHVFSWLHFVLPFSPTPMQKDGLTLAAMFLGAALSPLIAAALRRGKTAAPTQLGGDVERGLFIATLLAICAVFLLPYVGTIRGVLEDPTLFGAMGSWLPPSAVVGVLLAGLVGYLIYLLFYHRGSDRFYQALILGFMLSLYTFFLPSAASLHPTASQEGNLFERAARNVQSWWVTFRNPEWALITALAAFFAVAFALMYTRNPRAVIRIAAVGLGLVVADRLLALAGPVLPGLTALLQTWEQGLATAP